jgi:DNA polymerase I-like protein with 3'-5' exonuclease and polymerase domains
MYGMGAKLMSNILNVSTEECINILDEFYKMFPAVKEFTQANEKMAKELGYVEDYMGRRRHLPDANLPEIEVRAKKNIIANSDVFIDMDNTSIELADSELNKVWTNYYNENFVGKGFKAKSKFKEEAKNQGVDVFDNGAFISKTLTQCTNARIQGGAATLTKKAMVNIYNNDRLNKLGFRLLIPVHDELLGECPIENAEEVEKLLAETMIAAGKPECSVDMKVDTYTVKHWYADEVNNAIRDDYIKKIGTGVSEEDAISYFINEHPELSQDVVKAMCLGEYDVLTGDV